MSIRAKTIIVILTTLGVLGLVVYLVSSTVILGGFKKIEIDNTKQNVERFYDAIENNLLELSTKLSDWASWDDTYYFIQDRNEKYVESNLANESLAALNINMMIFIDGNGEIVKSRVAYLYPQLEEMDLPNTMRTLVSTGSAMLINNSSEKEKRGIIKVPEGFLLFAARPILTSKGEGPAKGTLIFARYFDEQIISYLKEITHLSARIYSYSDPNLPEELQQIKSTLEVRKPITLEVNEKSIIGYTLVNDINKKPLLIICIDQKRNIYQQGLQSIYTFTIMGGVFSFILGLVIIFLLEKVVVSRLSKLGREVVTMGTDTSMTQRVSESGHDELAILARTINGMADKLREYYKVLQQKSNELIKTVDEIKRQNIELEQAKKTTSKLLDDALRLEEELKKEKENVEHKVEERTKELSEKTKALEVAKNEITKGWMQIQEEKAKLTASINSLPHGFILTDHNGNILMTNNFVSKTLGPDTKLNNLEDITQIFLKELDLKSYFEKCLTNNQSFSIPQLQYSERFLRLYIIPITIDVNNNNNNNNIGLIILIEDITEAKILERAKDEFFSIASHELRTPLTSIRGNTSLIKEYYPNLMQDNQLAEMINDVHDSSIRLIGIVNDFLNVSRLEQGKVEFKKDQLDIKEVITEAVKDLENLATRKNIYLKLNDIPDQITMAVGDKDKVKEIIYNLIGNAIKFTELGGVTLEIKNDQGFIQTYVSDTGRGIPLQYQPLLFRRFQQAGASLYTRDTTKGTGLGLYISKMFAKGMSGEVQLVSSEEGKGTTFVFSLPQAA